MKMKNDYNAVFRAITGKYLTIKEISDETGLPVGSVKLYISKSTNYGKSLDRVKKGQIFTYRVIDDDWVSSNKKADPESIPHFNQLMSLMNSCMTDT
jgi:DNA-directed RNA polymerase specialized sigma24 family protein